jgi:hypothetical protein
LYTVSVPRLKVPQATRTAIWYAHAKKCAYCGEPISFPDLEIDHVLPETLKDDRSELERLRSQLGAHAQIASASYVSNPYVGIADLHLLSKDLLPYIDPHRETLLAEMTERSLRELARNRKLLIVDVSSIRLHFEWMGAGAILEELMSADLGGDGLEEILIEYHTYAVGGTLGLASVGVLRRFGPEEMFEYLPHVR